MTTNLKRQTPRPITHTHTYVVCQLFFLHHFLTCCLTNLFVLFFSQLPWCPSHPTVGFLLPEGKTLAHQYQERHLCIAVTFDSLVWFEQLRVRGHLSL